MSIRFAERTVPLSHILMEDTSFRVTTDADKPMESLVASIESVGLLSPPILRPLVEGRFQVVSGFRRLRALLSLGRASAECRIVEDGAEDPLTCLKLGIADNASRRNLNPVEQALAVDRILAFVRDTDRGCAILSSLGVPVNPLLAGKLKTLLSLPRPILDYVAREAVAFPVALFLAGLNESDALILADIFADLRLGTNKQREVAVLAQEIAAREETSISGLLEKDGEIRTILEDPEEDRGLKAARLRVCLEKRRFPVLSRSRECYRELEKRLKLGRRTRLRPPENFEGSDFVLELTFSDMSEFRRHAAQVDRLAAGDLLKTILERCGSPADAARKQKA